MGTFEMSAKKRRMSLLDRGSKCQDINANSSQPLNKSGFSSVKVEERSFSQSCMNVSHSSPPSFSVTYSLSTVEKPQIDDTAFGSINGELLANLLRDMDAEEFLEKHILIDCRYPFEFEGGHVKNAINIFRVEQLIPVFYPSNDDEFEQAINKVPIFYCEFSQKRGPEMARELRRFDRNRNLFRYPQLDYPEIYVLDRGYRLFFHEEKFQDLCEPQFYVPMSQPSFSDELAKYSQHKKGSRKRRRNLVL